MHPEAQQGQGCNFLLFGFILPLQPLQRGVLATVDDDIDERMLRLVQVSGIVPNSGVSIDNDGDRRALMTSSGAGGEFDSKVSLDWPKGEDEATAIVAESGKDGSTSQAT